MVVRDSLSWLKHRLGLRNKARQRQRNPLPRFVPRLLPLEDRCLMSAGIPIPSTQLKDHLVPLSTIFWNGEAKPLDTTNGKDNIPSPQDAGAAKTITITNYHTETIYPFLRTENSGRDPNDSQKRYYDPQDLHTDDKNKVEFRQYVGFSKSDGSKYLGLPPGATITFQVPLVLWDGNNMSLVTDGANLTTPPGQPADTVFNYKPDAKITIAGLGEKVSGSSWVLPSSRNYPTGQSPLVMFYFSRPNLTVSDAAPSQPAEVTFRDPYLKHFIDDPFQTFPLLNYEVSNVNKLAAPGAMEASMVPITSGAFSDNTLKYYDPPEDFGWHGSDKDLNTLRNLITDFVNNTGKAKVGSYFPDKRG